MYYHMSLFPITTKPSELNCRHFSTFQPYFDELQNRPLSAENSRQWLQDWSQLTKTIAEAANIIHVERTIDTTDPEREQRYLDFVQQVQPHVSTADQALKERLLALNLPDADLHLILRTMKTDAKLFRQENVPIFTQIAELDNTYDKVTGAMTVDWRGETKNLMQLNPHIRSNDRAERQEAWLLWSARWLQDREQLNGIYADMLKKRDKVAKNAGILNYRDYAFQTMGRFDYTPDDCTTFHNAIEQAVVPVATRIMARKQAEANHPDLRPWDWIPDIGFAFEAGDAPLLNPYQGQEMLVERTIAIFQQVDPALGAYMQTMADDGLLDLDTRQGKALGGYCTDFPVQERPFIYMNGTGLHDDVQTMLHEAGHAFHVFESTHLPLYWHTHAPMEFCEVASMSMELLAAPYLTKDRGGFYNKAEATRARISHLESAVLFFPYMAVVDGFQHWVYTHPQEAMNSDNCDAKWLSLWQRFLPGVNWEGHEATQMTGWHRKPHIFGSPFYYIEYGMAQVGALQVWRNSLSDPDKALADYRQALALGGTAKLPALFEAAGAQFRFDAEMLGELMDLVEVEIEQLNAGN
jgi:oligoendopeptidase F